MIITPYRAWITMSPPVIPKLYWDAYSQEERIKKICCKVDGLEKYLSYLSEKAAELEDQLRKEFEAALAEAQAAINEELARLETYVDDSVGDLKKWVEEHTLAEGVWDVTRGLVDNSIEAMRRLFSDVTTEGITVDQLAGSGTIPSVDALAESGWNVRALAVIGARVIDIVDTEQWEPAN